MTTHTKKGKRQKSTVALLYGVKVWTWERSVTCWSVDHERTGKEHTAAARGTRIAKGVWRASAVRSRQKDTHRGEEQVSSGTPRAHQGIDRQRGVFLFKHRRLSVNRQAVTAHLARRQGQLITGSCARQRAGAGAGDSSCIRLRAPRRLGYDHAGWVLHAADNLGVVFPPRARVQQPIPSQSPLRVSCSTCARTEVKKASPRHLAFVA